MMALRTVDEYLKLPYTVEVIRDESGDAPGYVARVVELPGCITQGDTFEELGEMLEDAMRLWIEVTLEDGREVPEPRGQDEYSGEFVVRVPRSLHRQLVAASEQDGVSLNTFVNVILARAVGIQQGEMRAGDHLYQMPARQFAQVAERASDASTSV